MPIPPAPRRRKIRKARRLRLRFALEDAIKEIFGGKTATHLRELIGDYDELDMYQKLKKIEEKLAEVLSKRLKTEVSVGDGSLEEIDEGIYEWVVPLDIPAQGRWVEAKFRIYEDGTVELQEINESLPLL